MNRVCVKLVSCAARAFAIVATTIVSAASPAAAADRLPISEFSAALSNDPQTTSDRGYQYADQPRIRPFDRGYQFADPQTPESRGQTGHSPSQFSAEQFSAGGHADIHQAQYPLSNRAPEELESAQSATPSEPRFVPPIMTPPAPAPPARPGWGWEADLLGDVTHVIGQGNTLGMTSLTAQAVMETPRLPGVSVRPHFGWHFVHGPRRTDLPGQLYDASLEARMYWPFHDQLIGEFALAPSIFTDGDNTSGDALRIVGRGVGYYIWSPDVKLAAGATYLDRKDILVLPIAGVIWTPTPDHRLDLLFPQPRIAHRYRHDAHHERWVYLSGELGGGSWAIERRTGRDDIVSYRDLRLITGIEWKYSDGSSWRIEGGYIFDRELEYESHVGDYQPSNTSMIRAGIVY